MPILLLVATFCKIYGLHVVAKQLCSARSYTESAIGSGSGRRNVRYQFAKADISSNAIDRIRHIDGMRPVSAVKTREYDIVVWGECRCDQDNIMYGISH